MSKYTYGLTITLLGLLCLNPISAKAAPQIIGVTGAATHGASMTVTGAGFGTGDTTPLTWDDFEAGTVGQNLSNSPKVGTWSLNSSPTPQYGATYHHSGTKASYGSKTATGGDIFTSVLVPNSSGSLTDRYYYASWWGYWHANCSNRGQVKLIQFWGTYQQNDYSPGFFHGGGSSTYIALENAGMTHMEWTDDANSDGWSQYQLVLKQSDINVPNGVIQIYLNGALIYNKVNIITHDRTGSYWQKLIPHEGMTNQSGCSGDRFFALDDIYMNNSWARVVLGNASTYAASTKLEIQPVDWTNPVWSSTNINIKANTGSYTSGQTAYLYVIDAAGAVNANGFALKIGSGGSGGTTPPASPTNLRVQ